MGSTGLFERPVTYEDLWDSKYNKEMRRGRGKRRQMEGKDRKGRTGRGW
jgi:hypothetical protein